MWPKRAKIAFLTPPGVPDRVGHCHPGSDELGICRWFWAPAADLRNRLIPAVPVPFRADGTIHGDRPHSRYVDHMAGQPIGGVAVWAHTGRGLSSTGRTAMRDPDGVAARPGGGSDRDRPPGAARARTRARRRLRVGPGMARQAADLGADALLVHPPTAFRGRRRPGRPDPPVHAAIAEAGLPLVLVLPLRGGRGDLLRAGRLLAELLATARGAGDQGRHAGQRHDLPGRRRLLEPAPRTRS